MLEVTALNAFYDEIPALRDLSLEVSEREVVALIGANGAGKTTLLKTIMGLISPRSGRIRFRGEAIQGRTPESVASRGIVLVPEGRRIFPGLTVLENLEVACGTLRLTRHDWQQRLEEVYALFPVLAERGRQRGWSLSGGEQQMLALARGLVRRPALLMLDEPSLGLAPRIIATVIGAVRRINSGGTTILLVEQNARAALSIANRVYVIQNGSIVLAGDRQSVQGDERFQAAYLGKVRM